MTLNLGAPILVLELLYSCLNHLSSALSPPSPEPSPLGWVKKHWISEAFLTLPEFSH